MKRLLLAATLSATVLLPVAAGGQTTTTVKLGCTPTSAVGGTPVVGCADPVGPAPATTAVTVRPAAPATAASGAVKLTG